MSLYFRSLMFNKGVIVIMRKVTFRQNCILAIVLTLFLIAGNAFSAKYIDPTEEININFPDSIRLKTDGRLTIEFCPDNTCDAFVAERQTSLESLKDFVYLFVFFYSDYYVLDTWRDKDTAKTIIEHILSKPQYSPCKKSNVEDTARCILSRLSQKGQIKLLAIRYDERRRNVVKRDLNAVLSKAPIKRRK